MVQAFYMIGDDDEFLMMIHLHSSFIITIHHLVGGVVAIFYFPHILWEFLIIPIDELHHFSEGWLKHQPDKPFPFLDGLWLFYHCH